MDKVYLKVHFKDTWKEVSTGNVLDIEYSTETIHVDDQLEAEYKRQKMKEDCGTAIVDGIEHTREYISADTVEDKKIQLSKEQMFDFILNNACTIIPDGSTWTNTSGKKVKKKYSISINNTNMSGYDLEEAINYYVNNRKNMK